MIKKFIEYFINIGIDKELPWDVNSKTRLLNKLGLVTFISIALMMIVRIATSPIRPYTSLIGLIVIVLVFICHKKQKLELAKHFASFGFPIMLIFIIYEEGATFGEFIVYLLCITLSYILYEDRPFIRNLTTIYNLVLAILSYLIAKANFENTISSNTLGSICLFIASILSIHFLMSFYQLEIKRKNQEKENLIDSIEDKNIELERFAHISSHDLKEPLRNIVSFAELSLKSHEKQNFTKTLEYLKIIKTNAYQMHDLVSETLEMISYDKDLIEPTKVNLNDIIKIVIELLTESIERKNVSITKDDTLPNILAHKNEMISLFKNLIENGIKYNDNKNPKISITHKRIGDNIIFAIKDNGIGIKDQYKDSIFEMYKRLSNKSKVSGSGLGLAICKKIVEKRGGNIWVESNFIAGSTFFFSVPNSIEVKLE